MSTLAPVRSDVLPVITWDLAPLPDGPAPSLIRAAIDLLPIVDDDVAAAMIMALAVALDESETAVARTSAVASAAIDLTWRQRTEIARLRERLIAHLEATRQAKGRS